jgi:hypothetical protein
MKRLRKPLEARQPLVPVDGQNGKDRSDVPVDLKRIAGRYVSNCWPDIQGPVEDILRPLDNGRF